ncbi:MAG: hypothetical protein ACRCZO_09770, partial [Cetobacterium sp.]
WRDKALTELHLGTQVEASHLRATIRLNRYSKFNLSSFSAVKVHNKSPIPLINMNKSEYNIK